MTSRSTSNCYLLSAGLSRSRTSNWICRVLSPTSLQCHHSHHHHQFRSITLTKPHTSHRISFLYRHQLNWNQRHHCYHSSFLRSLLYILSQSSESYAQYTPPTPTRRNCRVASHRRCEHTRRQSWPSLQFPVLTTDKWRHNDVIVEKLQKFTNITPCPEKNEPIVF